MTDRETFLVCMQAAASVVGCYWLGKGQDRDPPTFQELVDETLELATAFYVDVQDRPFAEDRPP